MVELLEYLRGRGIPAPRYELTVEVAECTLIVQERLPGKPTPSHIDRPTLAAILAMVESFRDRGRDWHEERNLRRCDWPYHLVHLAFDIASMVALGWNTIDPAAMRLLNDALAGIDP